jgi:hypothetical protein
MKFQYIPPGEPVRVTIRITIFLLGLLVLLAGAVIDSDNTMAGGGGLCALALLLTALDP